MFRLRGAVKPDDEGSDHLYDDANAARKDGEQVSLTQWQQGIAASQQSQERHAEDKDCNGGNGHQQRGHIEGLGDIDIGGLVVVLCQMYARHHRHAHAEHQRYARGDQKQRRDDIDSCQRIAAHSLSHEDAVCNRKERCKHH